jgi:hypothetical protein
MHREEPNVDDKETDIADDPLVNAISGELHAINKRSDMKLLIALALNLAVVVLFARLHIKSMWLDLLEAAIVVTILGGTIYSVVRQKQSAAARHGLVCSVCGYRPGVVMILSAATTQRCRKCGSPLPIV